MLPSGAHRAKIWASYVIMLAVDVAAGVMHILAAARQVYQRVQAAIRRRAVSVTGKKPGRGRGRSLSATVSAPMPGRAAAAPRRS